MFCKIYNAGYNNSNPILLLFGFIGTMDITRNIWIAYIFCYAHAIMDYINGVLHNILVNIQKMGIYIDNYSHNGYNIRTMAKRSIGKFHNVYSSKR